MLTADRVGFTYRGGPKILHDVTFTVTNGTSVCILGPNGTGKTTLLRCLLGLSRPTAGRVLLHGRDLSEMSQRERARRIAYVPQSSNLGFPYPVFHTVLMGRVAHLGLGAAPSPRDNQVAWEALSQLGIEHLAQRSFQHISGGERQLVLIARAIASHPPHSHRKGPLMNIRRRLAGALTALSMLTLAACSPASIPEAGDTEKGDEETHAPASQERHVTDMAGRSIAVPKDITSVGTLGSVGVLNAFVQLMGAGSKILNQMPDRFATSEQWHMQYEFSPQLADGPVFEEGGEVIIEEILANQPDVTFTMNTETAAQLQEVGVPVIYLEWNDVEDVKDAVLLVGEVLNVPQRAEAYLAYFEEQREFAEGLIAGLDNPKTVLYGDPIEFRQPHVIAEWWIDQAGGQSVTDDGRDDGPREYTMEDLLAWDPQVLIVTSAEQKEEIAANATYAGISAVKGGNVHVIPSVAHIWGNRTVEQPLTILWTLHHLYPDLLSRADLETKIAEFYTEFFGYDLSSDQLENIIDR